MIQSARARYGLLLSTCVALSLIVYLGACQDKIFIPEGALAEQPIDLAGSWQLDQVLQNGVDISGRFDFRQLLLDLNMADGAPTSYTIDRGTAPFPIAAGGEWALDDVVYPTSMQFTGAGEMTSVTFEKPPISQNDRFSIAFSLGCGDNIYVYTFRKQ